MYVHLHACMHNVCAYMCARACVCMYARVYIYVFTLVYVYPRKTYALKVHFKTHDQVQDPCILIWKTCLGTLTPSCFSRMQRLSGEIRG